MSMPITCPQCRANLKLPDALPAGRVVACPNCQLKFVPPDPAAPAATTGGGKGTAIVVTLMALILGAGGGVIIWNAMANRQQDPAKTVQASSDKAAPNKDAVQDGSSNQSTPSVPSAQVAGSSPMSTAPAPNAPAAKDDEIPDQPQPMTKKPPQKSYAETKRPQIDEPPPAPTPIVNVKPALAPSAEHARQKEINEAIDKGIAYLKSSQLPTGAWPQVTGNNFLAFNHEVGYTAIAGLTLLECQAPADDPAVQKAAEFVRSHRVDETHRTYELSCVILFLDRLGDPKDKTMIQSYALQLVAGQNTRAGWGYNCPELTPGEMQQLLTFLEATRPALAEVRAKNPAGKLDDPLKGAAEAGGALDPTTDPAPGKPMDPAQPPAKKAAAKPRPNVPAFQSLSRTVSSIPVVYQHYHPKGVPPPQQLPGGALNLMASTDDNSNSQFAMLGLWAARRHGVPSDLCLRAAGQRYRLTQHKDGGWSYSGITGMGAPGGIAQLMGNSTSTMTCVGLLGLAMGHGVSAKPPAKLADDPAIAGGLRKLGEHISQSEMGNFYLLWSIERVGVLYQQKTIGGADWYDTGVAMLLPSQKQPEGSWSTQGYQGSTTVLDTCFALLFLKRANLVQDLTERLPFLMSITESGTRPNR